MAYPHEKHMGSYEMFAWGDAMALASLLEREYDVRAVRQLFEQMVDKGILQEFEDRNYRLIQELVRRTEGQRAAYIRKVGKDVTAETRGLLVALAIVAQVRVRDMLQLRDRYRLALAPGSGNRVTCAEVYAFQLEAARLRSFDWPDEVFSAYGGDSGWDEDDDPDEEED